MRFFTIAMNGEAGSVYKGPRDYFVRRPPLQCTQVRGGEGSSATPGGIKTVFVSFFVS